MPTVLRIGAYRLFFFAGDRYEPAHIHIERDDNLAKFWRNYSASGVQQPFAERSRSEQTGFDSAQPTVNLTY